jgi:antitoxin HicB
VSIKDKRFHIRIELADEGGYVVSIPELPGCVTQGETVAEALTMVQEAMEGLLIVADKYGDPIPPQFAGVLDELKVNPNIAG